MKTIAEINARLEAIRNEMNAEGADLEALNAEADGLLQQRSAFMAQNQQRSSLLDKIARGLVGSPVDGLIPGSETTPETRTLEEVIASPEYRSAWAKTLMRKPDSAFTDVEKRALGVATTTTATTAVASSASADGVNNGGLFIPESVMDTFLNKISLMSPIFRDVNKINVVGIITLPYKKRHIGAKAQVEGVANSDTEFEWGDVTLINAEVATTCRVSWKLESMTPDSFINYLINELTADLAKALVYQLIYGTGINGDTLGIANSEVIDGDYILDSEDELAAIQRGLEALEPEDFVGAKIYLSKSASLNISFAKDENGAFLINPLNGVGLKSIAEIQTEVDPFLRSGDFCIGELARNVTFNLNDGFGIVKEVKGSKRQNEYTAYALGGVGVNPNTIVFGSAVTAAVGDNSESDVEVDS